ncbi:MAG: BamA/TamA family outer membrane protein [Chitinophagaceae bacterium]|nr:BamA/TamA family outer membrane protein [Chitinophagaceae bacterium]
MALITKVFIALLFSSILFSACSNVKHMPKNEVLYTGAKVKVQGPDLKARQKKVLTEDLTGLTRPRPNSKILGFRVKLYIYNLLRKKKEKSFLGRLRSKWGEPPVLLSQLDLQKNHDVLNSYLENKGFFYAKVDADTVVKRRRAHATYDVKTGYQYHIASTNFESDSSELTQAILQIQKKTLLKKDEPFDLDVIKGERNRIDAYLKEHGFYYFSPDFLLVKVDSNIGNHKVNLYVTVKPDAPNVARRIYKINDVYIYSNYNLNTAAIDTNKANLKEYKGFNIVDKENTFKPKMFRNTMQFQPGDVYNRTDHNLTLSRLINLNLFKFVKNRFEPIAADSPKLDAYYYLTPLPKKNLRVELTGTSKSNNLNGSEINLTWRNRNMFRAGEQVTFSTYIGSEVQFGGTLRGYNTYRTGAEVNFVVPRFFVPWFNIPNQGAYAPRTNLKLGYDVLRKNKLYDLNSFRFAYGYLWRRTPLTQNEFYPISINYVQPLRETQEWIDSVNSHPTLKHTTEKQFILGTTYQYTYNDLLRAVQRINSFYFGQLVDLSGNVANLIKRGDIKHGDTAKIFNAAYSTFIKLETDGRYYRKIGLYSTWANRIILGYGLPYGNSSQLPYIKQFFAGGTNSIRAFRSRTVGPGTYYDVKAARHFYPEQTGDIRFESNTEFRPHISGPLYGAVFIDAGNIWLKNKDPERPGAEFTSNFLNQLAVGTGVGLRLDITLFVIRLDVAIPLRKPWEIPPSVIRQIDFFNKTYRRENIVYNLAIGYPF